MSSYFSNIRIINLCRILRYTIYIGQQDAMEMINCCCFSIFVKGTFIVLIITKAKSPKFIGLED